MFALISFNISDFSTEVFIHNVLVMHFKIYATTMKHICDINHNTHASASCKQKMHSRSALSHCRCTALLKNLAKLNNTNSNIYYFENNLQLLEFINKQMPIRLFSTSCVVHMRKHIATNISCRGFL